MGPVQSIDEEREASTRLAQRIDRGIATHRDGLRSAQTACGRTFAPSSARATATLAPPPVRTPGIAGRGEGQGEGWLLGSLDDKCLVTFWNHEPPGLAEGRFMESALVHLAPAHGPGTGKFPTDFGFPHGWKAIPESVGRLL